MTENIHDLAKPVLGAAHPDVREMLSKVLFPDELVESVNVLGVNRFLRPLPIKWSKKLYARLQPVTDVVSSLQNDKSVNKDFTLQMVEALEDAVRVLCDYYKWDDVLQAIDAEEILIVDLQNLVVAQRSIQGTSDFTFTPCSLLVGMMQVAEIGTTNFMKLLSGQATSNNTNAPSTS